MKITRTSPLTGQTNTLDLPVDRRASAACSTANPSSTAFPDLDAAEREFIKNGLHARPIRNLLRAFRLHKRLL